MHKATLHISTLVATAALFTGCVQVKTEPIDINLNISGELRLKIDQQLDTFFDDLDAASTTLTAN